MRRVGTIAGMALFAALLAAAAGARAAPMLAPEVFAPVVNAPELAAPAIVPAIIPVVDRLEMRSYQPYSTLQYGFRPVPPVQRGVARKQLEIVKPQRLAPLIPYGSPTPWSAKWYAYCAKRYQSFEPGTGLYTSFSGNRRLCH